MAKKGKKHTESGESATYEKKEKKTVKKGKK